MFTYLVIIYLAFLVFLVIIGALNSILIPALQDLPSQDVGSGGPVGIGNAGSISETKMQAYSLIFFHAALLQGLFSGLLAGQMGEGSVKNGAKHATIMILIAYTVFTFVL